MPRGGYTCTSCHGAGKRSCARCRQAAEKLKKPEVDKFISYLNYSILFMIFFKFVY